MVNIEEMARKFFELEGRLYRNAKKASNEIFHGELAALNLLVHGEDGMTPGELSNRFEVSTARVANTLNSLEKKGYIERVHDTVDRRKVTIHATAAGKKLLREKEVEATENFAKFAAFLGEEDTENLNRILTKFEMYFDQIVEDTCSGICGNVTGGNKE